MEAAGHAISDAAVRDKCTCGASRETRTIRCQCTYRPRRALRCGEEILLHEDYSTVSQLKLSSDSVHTNRYGTFSHNSVIGRAGGTRWHAETHATRGAAQCAGFVHATRFLPGSSAVWTPHRTQVIYPSDAALLVLRAKIKAAHRVIEAGTGSAAFTSTLASVVGRHGRVHSFEFHSVRAAAAEHTLKRAGFEKANVKVELRDVVAEGFGENVQRESVNAVFLDLPNPEFVLKEARRVLKGDCVLAVFTPCVEQVLRVKKVMRDMGGWHSITTVTATTRTWETRIRGDALDKHQLKVHYGRVRRPNGETRLVSKPYSEMKGHTSYLTFATKCIRWSQRDDKPAEEAVLDAQRDSDGAQNGILASARRECTLS